METVFLALALAVAGCSEALPGDPIGSETRRPTSLAADELELKAPMNIAVEIPAEAASQKSALPPKVIYLLYADGTTAAPGGDLNACPGAVPKFDCTFGTSLLDCEEQIQVYLDRWFADFNVIFTVTRPTTGTYYTAVVSSGGGSWCNQKDTVAGVAPMVCRNIDAGIAYTLDGGGSAHDTAVIIAHEEGHLLGLEHVADSNEIMYPSVCLNCDGFEDETFSVPDDMCNRPGQNSYQMMMQALGPWRGGPKPSAFHCIKDTTPPVVSFVSPTTGGQMGHDFSVSLAASDDCELARVALTVEPQGLSASASKGPFEWNLTGIAGSQTITATASDTAGNVTVTTLAISSPLDAASAGRSEPSEGLGCAVASGPFGPLGLLSSGVLLVLFLGQRSRSGPNSEHPGVSGTP